MKPGSIVIRYPGPSSIIFHKSRQQQSVDPVPVAEPVDPGLKGGNIIHHGLMGSWSGHGVGMPSSNHVKQGLSCSHPWYPYGYPWRLGSCSFMQLENRQDRQGVQASSSMSKVWAVLITVSVQPNITKKMVLLVVPAFGWFVAVNGQSSLDYPPTSSNAIHNPDDDHGAGAGSYCLI